MTSTAHILALQVFVTDGQAGFKAYMVKGLIGLCFMCLGYPVIARSLPEEFGDCWIESFNVPVLTLKLDLQCHSTEGSINVTGTSQPM